MPRVKRKIDKNATYESWCAFAAADPPNTQVGTGERFRGDHPVVQTHPHWFVEAGSAPHTWPTQLGTTEAPPPKPDPTNDIALTVEPRPLDGVVEATKDIRVLLSSGVVNLTGGMPGRLITYTKGTRFKSDAELVGRLPDNYFKVV
jgi:hypothetical protein